jgi:SAM-dependent methyltransferase
MAGGAAPVSMKTEDAILRLRADPQYSDLVRDAYLGPDVRANAERFHASAEFSAVQDLVGRLVAGGSVLDLGAGTGIASYAFAVSGARHVVALEPDPSDVVGQGAIRRIGAGLPITIVSGAGESLPFCGSRFDLVYARQVLHHARDLDAVVRECARVTVPGGMIIATREHVVNGKAQLDAFLAAHPVHQLAGGEHAYPQSAYVGAFRKAGLDPTVFGPYDSVVNAFPQYLDGAALHAHGTRLLTERFRRGGRLLAAIPGAAQFATWWTSRRIPGRLYTFLVTKR